MIDKDSLDSYKKAGRIAADAVALAKKRVGVGISVNQLLDDIDAFIISKGAIPAFPAQMAINHVAAHFCPGSDVVVLAEGDIAKLDLGVCQDGYVADTAKSFDLGGNGELLRASEDALQAALRVVRPGVTLNEIGLTIQERIESAGFAPIRNLSGHGLGFYKVHGEPTIPNIRTGDKTELEEGMVIAIEPFATNGAGIVYETANPTLYSFIQKKPVRSPMTRDVLRQIETYNGLPFATKWLERKFGPGKTAFALRELMSQGILESHPPLLEKAKGLVSQAEHSIIVANKPIVYTRADDE